eukprot:591825_1
MCHGVASELLTEVKRFAGHTLPQQLQLYQSQATNNAKSFGYMDLPAANNIGGISGLGPTAPMTSTGLQLNDDINSFHHQQALLNKLTQINYMQQLNALNTNPYAHVNAMNQFTANAMPFQQQQQELLLNQQQLLVQQQLHELNNSKKNNKHHTQPPLQQRHIHNTQPPPHAQQQQQAVFKSNNQNSKAQNEINNEYMRLLAEVEAKKNKKKKNKKHNKKRNKSGLSSSLTSSSDESDSDSDDSDDDDSDSDDSSDSDEDSDDSSDSEDDQKRDKTKASMTTQSAPNDDGGIGLVDDDVDMKYPPIPFGGGSKDINLEPLKTPHAHDEQKQKKESKKALKKNKKKKRKKKKKKSSSLASSSVSDSSDSDEESDSDESDEDDTDSDEDSEDEEEDSEEEETDSDSDSDEESDSDESDEDDTDSDEDSEDEEEDSEEEETDSDSDSEEEEEESNGKFEDDLDLLLSGNIEEYISKKMPLAVTTEEVKEEVKEEEPAVVTKMHRPHSLSIQIRDVEELQEAIGDVKHEEESDDDDDDDDANEAEILGKSRNRKIDRILRGSKSNLDYAKNVLGMVETDRNTPQTAAVDTGVTLDYSDVVEQNKHKQHLDDMIANIMAGKEFVPFEEEIADKARESEDELDAIDAEMTAAAAAVSEEDEDVEEMFNEKEEKKSFQSLITAALVDNGGHHKRQSTRLLLDSLRTEEVRESQMVITWGMILIELDNFASFAEEFERSELISIISTLIDEALEYENQYVDHMSDGQFVLLTPVDIVVGSEENVIQQKEDRLHDIAASVLHHLSQEEEQLEFCMGVALQDGVSSDQEWFEIARQSLEEMKRYREMDRKENKILTVNRALDMVSAADLDYQDGVTGDTALIIAIKSRKSPDVIATIMKNGCNVNLRNKKGMSALMVAAMNGDNDTVMNLSQHESINLDDANGKSALLFAAENGHREVVKTLLAAGADMNCCDDDNQSNVLMCAVNNNDLDLIKFVLNYPHQKININAQNRFGYTALMIAAYNGNQYVVQILINHAADINVKNESNENAYAIARKANHIDLCQILLPLQYN